VVIHFQNFSLVRKYFYFKEYFISDNFNWKNVEDFSDINEDLAGDYLKNHIWGDKDNTFYFVVGLLGSNNSSIVFFRDETDIMDYKVKIYVDSNLDIDIVKKILLNEQQNIFPTLKTINSAILRNMSYNNYLHRQFRYKYLLPTARSKSSKKPDTYRVSVKAYSLSITMKTGKS